MENATSVESSTEVDMEYTTEEYMERAISNGIAASVSVGGSFDFFSVGVEVTESQTQTETSGSSSSASMGSSRGSTWGSTWGSS